MNAKVIDDPAKRRLASVLVIDDEPMVCRTLVRCVAPHHVTTSTDPVAALELLLEHDYDIVFCDIMMPSMSGIELFDRFVAKRPDRADAFVFISGGALDADLRRRLLALDNYFLPKPFELPQIRTLVESHVNLFDR